MKNWVAFIILLIFFIFIYHSAPTIFFRQDEWLGFGSMIGYGTDSIFSRSVNDAAHFVPITLSIDYLLFQYFHLNYVIYNLLGLSFHLINSFLVYLITKEILKKNKHDTYLALLAGIFFITSSTAVQLILWTVISINSLSLTISLIIFWLILRYKRFHSYIKFGVLISLLTLLSLLILEYSAGLLIFVPITLFIYREKVNKKQIKIIIGFVSTMTIYLGTRLFFILQSQGSGDISSNVVSLLQRIIEFPLRYTGQIILPERLNLGLSNLITDHSELYTGSRFIPERLSSFLSHPLADSNISEYLLFKIFAILAGLVFFGILLRLIVYTKLKQETKLKDLLVVSLFTVFSAFPFIIIPGQLNDFNIFPSRYLYFGLAGFSILLAIVVKILFKSKKRLLFAASLIFIFISIVYGTLDNWYEMSVFYNEGQMRQGILSSIKNSYLKLPEKVVFFSESDSSFYGLADKDRILPFQSGFGQTLLVWYQLSENFPKEFFQNKFLWEIRDQGYREFDGRGFGYFREFTNLAKLLEDKKLPLDAVIAFKFDSGRGSVQDITSEVRGRLEGYMIGKIAVDAAGWTIFVSNNYDDAWMAIDGDRKTAWDSKLTYNHPQYFTIDLSKIMTVAQITIDTYNNVNQNQVGFAISLSSDGKTWADVFYAKRYPPDDQGYINIYFKPQLARFIKISQIGNHAYANWVIHDLKIYEKGN